MIGLYDDDIKTAERKSSKGNQLKFERDGIWYKADNLGYEGLSECVVSALLRYSSLRSEEYTEYSKETIEYNGNLYNGCKSRDFSEGWTLITLERLFTQTYGRSLNNLIYSTEGHTERLKLIVDQTERITGLKDFGVYMNKLMTIDALFLNEDRHTHNLAVLMNDKKDFRLCPIFDNGAALLADTKMDYPLGRDVYAQMESVKPKTFSDSFEEQLEISEQLYGTSISFSYTEKDVEEIVDHIEGYGIQEKERVKEVIAQTRRKYGYLFEKKIKKKTLQYIF